MTLPRWLALLPLAGCAGSPQATPQAAPQACELRQVADIAVGRERGFISAPATIEGKPVTLLIDTGAEATMVTPSAVAELQLGADPRHRTVIQGAGGSIVTQNARLQSFGIGGMELLDQSVSVGPLPVSQGAALHASGLLGAETLGAFDVEIDLPHDRVRLFRAAGCSGSDYLPWSGPRTSALAQIYGRGLVLLPASLDGHDVRVLLDTGANRSVLGEAAADRMGLDAAALQGDPAGRAVGVDGAIRTSRQHRFDALRVAGLRTTGLVISVSPLRLGTVDLLLGDDWLSHVKVWISYANHRITVQPG
jgi:predicted aspartyl protease